MTPDSVSVPLTAWFSFSQIPSFSLLWALIYVSQCLSLASYLEVSPDVTAALFFCCLLHALMKPRCLNGQPPPCKSTQSVDGHLCCLSLTSLVGSSNSAHQHPFWHSSSLPIAIHSCNPNTWESGAGILDKFKASLAYIIRPNLRKRYWSDFYIWILSLLHATKFG